MCHLVNRTAIHVLSQNHRIRDKMLHACTSRGATCTARQGRIVQTQNFIFGRLSKFFFYPNGTWTHPPTSKLFLDFLNFFNFAKPLRGFANYFFPKNPSLLWKWVGGSRSHSEFFLENLPEMAPNQYWYFWVVYNVYSVLCTLVKVVNYYELSVLSMSVMGFQKK